MLLSSENVNQEALLCYAREAADFGTNYQLPTLDFAMNHCGQPDVAMFDFTSMHASENAALVRERFGHQLLVALVGDSLLEVRKGNPCQTKSSELRSGECSKVAGCGEPDCLGKEAVTQSGSHGLDAQIRLARFFFSFQKEIYSHKMPISSPNKSLMHHTQT